MALKRKSPLGKIVSVWQSSKILKANPLGDPHVREVRLWLPPGYDSKEKSRYPVLYDLAGYTGSGLGRTNWKSFGDSVPERLDRLWRDKKIGDVIVVFPDCFTSLGGNQYVNSSALGAYEDYLVEELVPFVDATFRTLPNAKNRGCYGKSSGGYGAFVLGMKNPNVWSAVANHSGDAYFDFIYRRDWPNTLDELSKYKRRSNNNEENLSRGLDDGRVKRFLKSVWNKQKLNFSEGHCLMNLCMAATYDPDPTAPNGFRLPFHLDTGELIPGRWGQWLEHDPINLVKKYGKNLRKLRGIWIDCGRRDQYFIHYGSRILSRSLLKQKIAHRYEEFDDTHSDIDYRMDKSLPFLYSLVKGS